MSDEKKDVGFVEIKWVEGAGVYKRVPVADMEMWMKTGWRPLGMFRDLVTQEREESVRRDDGYYDRQRVYVDKECMCVLMVQDSTLMVAQYESEKNAANVKVWEAEQKAREAKHSAEKAEQAKVEALATAEEAERARRDLDGKYSALCDRAARLETDLAKVRSAIGNKAWKEILGQ